MRSKLSLFTQFILRKTLSGVVLLGAALLWPVHAIAQHGVTQHGVAQPRAAQHGKAQDEVTQTVRVDATPGHVVNTFSPLYALGSTVDRVPSNATDVFFRPDQIKQVLSAGWGVISYRQNTDLFVQAWHWNPRGTWSDPQGRGYFTGDATPTREMIRHSYGYSLRHRGFTRNGGTEFDGFSRLDDGDLQSYWKSNPYLTKEFTREDDSLHPQWVVIDFNNKESINAIRIAWGEPYAQIYEVQYWIGDGDAMDEQDKGAWKTFHSGSVTDGNGGTKTLLSGRLAGHHKIRPSVDDTLFEYLRHPWLRAIGETVSDTPSANSTWERSTITMHSKTCFIIRLIKSRR